MADPFRHCSFRCLGVIASIAFSLATCCFADTPASITVQADQPGITVSSNLFGIFFEEINSAGDGGIYAELVRNRSFEDATNAVYWTLVTSGSAAGQMSLDTSLPISSTNLHSLKLSMLSGSGNVGAANSGYWGIPVTQGSTYVLGLYARGASTANLPLSVSLESSNGASIYASVPLSISNTSWRHFTANLIPNTTDASARLVLRIAQVGTVWLDFVSLFPQATYNTHTNGLRPDLVNTLRNLKPSFVRFPGGSWVDGSSIANAYHWEPTIGDPANRSVRANLWGYMVDNGLGYHEYLQMCEDIGAQPLFVINCGMDVHENAVPPSQMASWVQEALDAIQYANSDTNTLWGAQRAANGHPAPFNLQFMEIGNENGGAAYNTNYALFYDAIKSSYPYMHLIADSWGGIPSSRPVEIMDEHYYSNPGFFIQNSTKYDSYSRTGPKVYIGEYAVTTGAGNGNLAGALGEAAWMTGMERNSDVVLMGSYAPLFANLNNKNWNPDLIYFTGTQVYGTPSYYVQQMFSENRGDAVLPTAVIASVPPATNHGAIGLSTWNTQAAFTNIVVTKNGQTLYQSDFTGGTAPGWSISSGTWIVSNGLFEQTAGGTDNRATTGDPTWSDYTLTLQALKLGGSEGFLIMFNVQDSADFMWLNIGGWNNTQTAVEWEQNGSRSIVPGTAFGQTIQSNQWYTIRVQLSGPHVQCYLNGTLIEDFYTSSAHLGSIGLGTWNTQSAFSNLVVTTGTQTLYQSDFTSGSVGWQLGTGTWITSNGMFEQTAGGTDNTATYGSTSWSNYTYNLRALKLSGSEGFLIIFNWLNNSNWFWWNIGGWNNTQTGIEYTQNGQKSLLAAVPMSINTGQWYDISIQLGAHIQCYLNGQLIHDVAYPDAPQPLFVSGTLAKSQGQVILKAVNVSTQPLQTQLTLNAERGFGPSTMATVLTSTNPLSENSLAQPTNVFPVSLLVSGVSTSFQYTFPANSLTIFRLQEQPDSPVGISLNVPSSQQDLSAITNGIWVKLSSFITNGVSVGYTIYTPAGVLASGTLVFSPGDLAKAIPLSIPNPQAFDLIRVTLSSPINGQLAGISRLYFVNSSGNQPRLGVARFPDESVVYWSAAAALQQSLDPRGPWLTLSNTVSPLSITFTNAWQLYRLQQ